MSATSRSRVRRWSVRLAACGAALAALALVAGWCGRAWWVLDLAAHFRVQELALLALAAACLALARAWRGTLICATFLVAGSWSVVPYWIGRPGAEAARREADAVPAHRLRVASLNVESGNPQRELVRRFVRESAADVLLLIEVDRAMLDALAPELAAYPERIEAPRGDPFGLALYAKLPLHARRIDELGSVPLPAFEAELELEGARATLVALHAPPPITASNARERDRKIEDAVRQLARTGGPAILLGDLNTTVWASTLPRTAFAGGLRDAREGHGLLCTWPADTRLLSIPIDHCLVSEHWDVLDARIGSACGSDHLGLVVDLALRP